MILNSLKKHLVHEKKNKAIFDIVIYGSLLKGKENPRDIDILVIFRSEPLRHRLEMMQAIKKKIVAPTKIDMQQILLEELFNPSFFARTGIFLEGHSVFHNKPFAEIIGFHAYALFLYSLQSFSHTERVKINYLLSGRNSNKGIIARYHGERIGDTTIQIPIQHVVTFEEALQQNKIPYKRVNILKEV